MKRLFALAVAMVFTFGAFSPAAAVEVRVSGMWEIGIGWAANTNFTKTGQGDHIDPFGAAQQIRPLFEFVASETLRGVLEFQIGPSIWGSNEDGSGAALDADQSDVIAVRRSYLDWNPIENLNLRFGVQGVALPSATFGSPILETEVAGIVANYRFNDTVSLTGFWLRPFDNGWSTEDEGANRNDEMDIFGFSLPVKVEGFSITPWAMYARNGNASNYWGYLADYNGNDYMAERFEENHIKGSSNLWWAGAAVELDMFDPVSVKFDGMYGSSTSSGDRGQAPEYSGFLLAALVEYNSEAWWGTPGILGWYASGDGSNDLKNENYGRMPILSTDRAGFAPTSYGFAGSMGCMQDVLLSSSGVGTWGIGVQLDGISFLDAVSHTLRVTYIGGTNDPNMIKQSRKRGIDERLGTQLSMMGDTAYLTRDDYALEFNLVSTWEATENFTLYLETHYINLELDSGTWGSANAKTTDAWKVQLLFEYAF